MTVTLEEAYREACLALGEAIVRERLLQQALASEKIDAEIPPCPPATTT